MLKMQVFTDGSVNTQLKVGYGAYLVVSDPNTPLEKLKETVKIKRFAPTSSTKLELQTLLWALHDIATLIDLSNITLTVYTDSQNILGLIQRRERLEQNNYQSSKNKPLNNAELYQTFYQLNTKLNFTLVKVAGHQQAHLKDAIDRLFTLVDKAARQALRAEF